MAKNKQNKPVRELLTNIRRVMVLSWKIDPKLFSFIIVLAVANALFPIALSYTFKLVLDELIKVQSQAAVITVTLLAFFSLRYVIELVFDFTSMLQYDYINRIFRFKIENYLTYKFTETLSNLDIAHFDNPETQSLVQKARENYNWRITNFIGTGGVFGTFTSLITFIGAFLVLLQFGQWIPVLLTIAVIPRFVLRNRLTKVQWSVFNQNIPESKELNYLKVELEDYSSLKEIRIFQAAPALLKKLQKLQLFIYETTKKPLQKYTFYSFIPVAIETVALFSMAYLKLSPTVAGVLTIGSFSFYISSIERIFNSSQRFIGGLGELYENSLYVGYYFDVLALPRLVKEKEPGYVFDEINPPEIEFQNVSFSYSDGPKILKNISFKLEKGKHLAIVGPNGAGKTTLIKLLLRFYDPTDGQILVNDHDLRDLKLDNWYRFVSILFQDFTKFWLTVKENIQLGNTKITDDAKMRRAASKAGADEFIEKLPKKYNQRLGRRFEESTDLSIGQWQKLALARAFYEEAPVLILDEPTSSIDAEAEEQIFENLYKVYDNKSLILISHRFFTVRNADKIIVLKDGKIAEEGNHESLMKASGIYARMFRKQAKGYVE